MGPGNTDKQLQMMMDLETTVITATSSYALLLAEEINKRDLKKKIPPEERRYRIGAVE